MSGGKGGYSIGNKSLNSSNNLYVCVGGTGGTYSGNTGGSAGYNGGGKGGNGYQGDYQHIIPGGAGGGGATHIAITTNRGVLKNYINNKSEIILVAGGGGGVSAHDIPGYAGGLSSNDSQHAFHSERFIAKGATQTSGYKFGEGASADRTSGGGGYYGGNTTSIWENSSRYSEYCASSGGSSFISGHTGCNAISASSTNTNIIHTGQPNHYSGYVFTNTVMKAGNESMPSPTGGTETGHTGNGYCKITWHPTL